MNNYIIQVNRRKVQMGIAQFQVQAKNEQEAMQKFFTKDEKEEVDEHIESTWCDDTNAHIINTSEIPSFELDSAE